MTTHKLKHMLIQCLRRCMQIFTILLIAAVAYISLYAHYRAANAIEDTQLMSGLRGQVLTRLDKMISAMRDPQTFLDGFKGTLWSMRIAGVDVSDPLAVAEFTATSKTFYLPFMLSIIIPLMVTLLLGRVFCSWICPANLLFEIIGRLRKILLFAEIKPPEIKFSLNNKYILLCIGLIIGAIVSQPLFALIYPPAVVSRLVHAWIFGTALSGMLILMLVLTAIEIFFSPRWCCRTMCPGGALYALLGWPRLLRVKLKQSRCTHCGICEPVCDPGIDPVRDANGIECTNCGKCIRSCPEKALYYSLGFPGFSRITAAGRHTLTNILTILIIFFVLSSALPRTVYSHHILGLPHYSYKENYPQVPVLEYPAQAGPYHVLLTSYPGKPLPNEAASLSFYIKNQTTGIPYSRPITIRVLQTFTFGRSQEIVKPRAYEPFDQTHKVVVTFPEDGEYIVELTLDIEGKTEVIPFMLVAGEPSATASVVGAVTVGLVLFFIIVRAIKIKRDRRAQKISQVDVVTS